MPYPAVVLKKGKEGPAQAFHPWIFSGAIDLADDTIAPGDLVQVQAADRSFLGIGYFNPSSQITVRLLTFKNEDINADFLKRRVGEAQSIRSALFSPGTNACRLINAEGDFLPGLVVDRYANFLAVQFQTLGMKKLEPMILKALEAIMGIEGIYERGDSPSRDLEGLEKKSGPLSGIEPPELVEIEENHHRFCVDLKKGQKTGFFLDQRENRELAGGMSNGKRVLNCFAYSGGFSVYAAKGGAQAVTSVEISKEANELSRRNFELNRLSSFDHSIVAADVFDYLRKDSKEYGLVILDPPAFCKSKHQVKEAARGYKDINLHAFKRMAPGGLLLTSSCSSFIDRTLFQQIIFSAARDSGRQVQILKITSHPLDHPVSVYHPEGEYLKSLFCRVI